MSDQDLRAADRAAALGDPAAADQAFAERVRRGDLGVAAELLLRFPEQSSRALAGLIPGEMLQRVAKFIQQDLDALGHVRLRPAMYVGDVRQEGLRTMLDEVLDSALERTFFYRWTCRCVHCT